MIDAMSIITWTHDQTHVNFHAVPNGTRQTMPIPVSSSSNSPAAAASPSSSTSDQCCGWTPHNVEIALHCARAISTHLNVISQNISQMTNGAKKVKSNKTRAKTTANLERVLQSDGVSDFRFATTDCSFIWGENLLRSNWIRINFYD